MHLNVKIIELNVAFVISVSHNRVLREIRSLYMQMKYVYHLLVSVVKAAVVGSVSRGPRNLPQMEQRKNLHVSTAELCVPDSQQCQC